MTMNNIGSRLSDIQIEDNVIKCRNMKTAKEEKIRQLLEELIESEMKYVNDLEEICRDYIEPPLEEEKMFYSLDRRYLKSMKRRASEQVARNFVSSSDSSRRISSEIDCPSPSSVEMRQIFCNIEDLKDYHSRVFLPRLKQSIASEEKLKELFLSEHSKLTRKYGRYCINYAHSINLIKIYIKYFSIYQFKNKLQLRIDGMLIKPIQRLTRYHMFLTSLSQCCKDLEDNLASREYEMALEAVLSAAEHTNTMMWVGSMVNCPYDLSAQGQLLKYGPVTTSLNAGLRRERLWHLKSKRKSSSFLFLFQQSIMLCSVEAKETSSSQTSSNSSLRPLLTFSCSLSVNQVRIRDTVEENENMFEIHRLENIKIVSEDSKSRDDKCGFVSKLRIVCSSLEDKNCWVAAINNEIKQLKCLAKSLSFD